VQSLAYGFIYRRMNTPLQRLDPRVKLLTSTLLFTLSILADRIVEATVIIGSVLLIAGLGRVLRRLWGTLTYTAAFALFIFMINALTLWDLTSAVVFTLRFVAIVAATSLFFLTTPPDEVYNVLRWFRLPRDVVFAFATAIRFVPLFILDALQIMDAQKSRGLEIEGGSILKRLRNLIPVLVPLSVTAFLRSAEMAEAMEARAYGATARPTVMEVLTMRGEDWVMAAASTLLFVAALLTF